MRLFNSLKCIFISCKLLYPQYPQYPLSSLSTDKDEDQLGLSCWTECKCSNIPTYQSINVVVYHGWVINTFLAHVFNDRWFNCIIVTNMNEIVTNIDQYEWKCKHWQKFAKINKNWQRLKSLVEAAFDQKSRKKINGMFCVSYQIMRNLKEVFHIPLISPTWL